MLEIRNLEEVFKQLDRWEAEVKQMAEGVARGLSILVFKGVLQRSAQYSGDFAGNWRYRVGSIDHSFTPDIFPVSDNIPGGVARLMHLKPSVLRTEGHSQAISYAMSQNTGKAAQYKLGSVAYISNSAEHDEPYAWLIEGGKIKFREGNSGAPVARTLDGIRSMYRVIGKKDALVLMEMKL